MQLDKYQAAILEMLFETTAVGESVDVLRFALSGDYPGEYVVAAAPVGNEGEHIALNLPRHSTAGVFVALTDKDPNIVARILANLEDLERERGLHLHPGEAVIIPDASPASGGPYAVLLLRTATLTDVAALPDTIEVAGHFTSFSLAVPLSKAEHDFRAEHGHDELLSRFEKDGKCLAF